MPSTGSIAPSLPPFVPKGTACLLAFYATDCPTCLLLAPYLNAIRKAAVVGISQDGAEATAEFIAATGARYPIELDAGLALSRAFDPESVPSLYLLSTEGIVQRRLTGFDKKELNELAASIGDTAIAGAYDGAPAFKPGCGSRHREISTPGETAPALNLYSQRGARASRIEVPDDRDPYEFAMEAFRDPLPVITPTVERVERMLDGTPLAPGQIVARIPPCYGEATIEKIAANAVMAGCTPAMMRVLIPLIRAACDERFNLHGVQATTHFAAPLVIVNGPVRDELGFACAGNVFSNVARANSTLGRAFQLLLTNVGGARPGEIDMSTLGNPGKFSWVIAENEEENPWTPLHCDRGLAREQSAVTLFAGDGIRGVSEHNARRGATVLQAICRVLATVWSYRMCLMPEAVVVLCPEHAKTLARDGFAKEQIRRFLFDHTGIPIGAFDVDTDGEGVQARGSYVEIEIGGEPCYRKFRTPEAIQIVVAGGTAGKFSAVIGSWSTGPRGSQMVTYPV